MTNMQFTEETRHEKMCTVSSFHVTGEFGPIDPDSSRTLKNGHDSTHSATDNMHLHVLPFFPTENTGNCQYWMH